MRAVPGSMFGARQYASQTGTTEPSLIAANSTPLPSVALASQLSSLSRLAR